MIKIVYIMGHGRSGSTILEMVLGRHPEIVSVGELCNFYRYGRSEEQYCSCGRKIMACPFWREIGHLVSESEGRDLAGQKRVMELFERRRFFWVRTLSKVVLQDMRHAYLRQLMTTYESITSVSRRSCLIDSSKNPLRGDGVWELEKDGKLEVFFVFMIRDGRGVIWSHKKRFRKNPENGYQMEFKSQGTLRTGLGWIHANMECDYFRRKWGTPRVLTLRYEDFCASPVSQIGKLCQFISVDPSPLWKTLQGDHIRFEQTHMISGNRIRMGGSAKIEADLEWEQRLSEREKKIFWLMAGWYAKRHGYRRDPVNGVE